MSSVAAEPDWRTRAARRFPKAAARPRRFARRQALRFDGWIAGNGWGGRLADGASGMSCFDRVCCCGPPRPPKVRKNNRIATPELSTAYPLFEALGKPLRLTANCLNSDAKTHDLVHLTLKG